MAPNKILTFKIIVQNSILSRAQPKYHDTKLFALKKWKAKLKNQNK